MSDHGGIFDTNSVLGMPTALDGGDTCSFYSSTYSETAERVQQKLVSMGVQGLAVDGLWGACSEDAFQLVFGEPTSATALQKHVGIDCDGFTKSIKNQCSQQAIYTPVRSRMPQFNPTMPQVNRKMPGFVPQLSQQMPPHTTQPIHVPMPGPTQPIPYVPPVPGTVAPMPETGPGRPWLKYGLVAAGLGGLGLLAYWYFMIKKEEPEPPVPGGRTVPVGTVE